MRAALNLIEQGIDPRRNQAAMLTAIKSRSFVGASGRVGFSASGDRTGVDLNFINRNAAGTIVTVGNYTSATGIINFPLPMVTWPGPTNEKPPGPSLCHHCASTVHVHTMHRHCAITMPSPYHHCAPGIPSIVKVNSQ